VQSATDSPQQAGLSVQQTPLDAAILPYQRTELNRAAPPSVSSEAALAMATEPSGAPALAASNGDIALRTEQAAAPATADSVTELVVTTQPAGARVMVNGIGWGIAPVTIRYLSEGDKRIRVIKDGYATEEQVVRLAGGRPRRLDIRLRSVP
jgi:hypothetical protein